VQKVNQILNESMDGSNGFQANWCACGELLIPGLPHSKITSSSHRDWVTQARIFFSPAIDLAPLTQLYTVQRGLIVPPHEPSNDAADQHGQTSRAMSAKSTTFLLDSSTRRRLAVPKNHASTVADSLEAQCFRYCEEISTSSCGAITSAAGAQSCVQSP
jgi:hypothetical protein